MPGWVHGTTETRLTVPKAKLPKQRCRRAAEQPSNTDLSRPTGIPTLWGKRHHPRLIIDPAGKREDGLGRVDRGTDKLKPRIPTLQGKNTGPVGKLGTVISADKPRERPS